MKSRKLKHLTHPGTSPRGLPKCRWCRKVLPSAYGGARGRLGLGHFCTDRCAHLWSDAVIKEVEAGVVLGFGLTLRQQKEINRVLEETTETPKETA